MSRIDPIMKRFIGNESADDLATDILEVLTEGSNVPEACLLYTSPSPRDLSTSRMPSSA